MILLFALWVQVGASPECKKCPQALVQILEQANQDLKYVNRTYDNRIVLEETKSQIEKIDTQLQEHTLGLAHGKLVYEGALTKLEQTLKSLFNSTVGSIPQLLDSLDLLSQQRAVFVRVQSREIIQYQDKNGELLRSLSDIESKLQSLIEESNNETMASIKYWNDLDAFWLDG